MKTSISALREKYFLVTDNGTAANAVVLSNTKPLLAAVVLLAICAPPQRPMDA